MKCRGTPDFSRPYRHLQDRLNQKKKKKGCTWSGQLTRLSTLSGHSEFRQSTDDHRAIATLAQHYPAHIELVSSDIVITIAAPDSNGKLLTIV